MTINGPSHPCVHAWASNQRLQQARRPFRLRGGGASVHHRAMPRLEGLAGVPLKRSVSWTDGRLTNRVVRLGLCLLLFATAAIPAVAAEDGACFQADPPAGWRTLENRGGWKIQYPPSWKRWSCQSCPDLSAPGVFVSFAASVGGAGGLVRVESLADKPPGEDTAQWFDQTKRAANLNPILTERVCTVNGLQALLVRYRNTAIDVEMEALYVASGSKMFEISFGGEKPHTSLAELPAYSTFQQMVSSFRAGGQ